MLFRSAIKGLVRRRYRHVSALDHISFSVEPGELVGYIGPNGAGKSTTVKVLAGILVPDSGVCEVMGRTPWKQRIAHVARIGVVFVAAFYAKSHDDSVISVCDRNCRRTRRRHQQGGCNWGRPARP